MNMDKEKLQLTHIAPYLPYGLKVKWGIRVIKMNTGQGSSRHWIGISSLLKWYNSEMIEKPTILLRPLSDLVKPLPSGEIPFIKLFEMYNRNEFSETPYKKKECDKIISCDYVYYEFLKSYECILKYAFETSNMGTLVYSFRYDPQLRRFLHRDETHERPLGVSHQIDLFNFLFEHHFDVYGLCEKGLAIDINKINE